MKTKVTDMHALTDEQILKEFVNRFRCDGAVLVYLDSNNENGFGRWRTNEGKYWVNEIMKTLKKQIPITKHSSLPNTKKTKSQLKNSL